MLYLPLEYCKQNYHDNLNLQSFAFEHVTIGERGRGLGHHQSPADVRCVTGSLDPPRDLDLEVGALSHGHVHGLRLLQLGEQNIQSGLVLGAQPGFKNDTFEIALLKRIVFLLSSFF